MKKVTVERIESPPTNSPADVVRPLSTALGTERVAVNYFELAPSESFGYAYHRHLDQEEVFYVLSGTVVFETESGAIEVRSGEAIRFAPGEFQLGRNRSDEWVIALALGAPRESTEIEYLRKCPVCGDETIQIPEIVESRNELVIRCTVCDSTVDELSF